VYSSLPGALTLCRLLWGPKAHDLKSHVHLFQEPLASFMCIVFFWNKYWDNRVFEISHQNCYIALIFFNKIQFPKILICQEFRGKRREGWVDKA
jgi:hypothetical protein